VSLSLFLLRLVVLKDCGRLDLDFDLPPPLDDAPRAASVAPQTFDQMDLDQVRCQIYRSFIILTTNGMTARCSSRLLRPNGR